MSAMPSPDKNEPSKITGSRVVGGNYTRHEQREFTWSAAQYGRQKYRLFCKTRPPVSFVMSKFQKHTVPLCKPTKNKEFCGGLWCGVGCTAKTSLQWHTILWMHSICSSLRAFWTNLSREEFKADKNSLSSLASSDVVMEFISTQDFFDRKSHCHTGNQSWLSSKYLLFLDQSEKSPESGLATDK